jgi:hypothetical protein
MTLCNRLLAAMGSGIVYALATALHCTAFGPAAAIAMPIASPFDVRVSTQAAIERIADLGAAPAPHRNVYQVYPYKDDAAWETIFDLANGALNTALVDPRRRDYYRQNFFYGGTPYNGTTFYGSPVYYGGPYYTYYTH